MSQAATPLLSVEHLTKVFETRASGWLGGRATVKRAVSDVSFELNRGEVLGIVGESGSGKTTLARMLLRLIDATSGRVMLRGRNVLTFAPNEVRSYLRPAVRMIFQEPDAVLNPGYTIGFGLERALRTQADAGSDAEISATVATLLQRVGLDGAYASKYPDELSGGEKRRVGICRALATNPEIIVADEPLSGLDVVLQERVLELLKSEQEKRQFALILVSHDLDRVNQVCDRVIVMHSGRVVEHTVLRRNEGAIREQYQHPYSMLLQQARVDRAGFDAIADIDDVDALPSNHAAAACSFAPSCSRCRRLNDPAICWNVVPPLVALTSEQSIACHFSTEYTTLATRGGNAVAALMSN